MIAGPCSVETREQMTQVAFDVQKAGAGLLRGGAFKPRTSPYSFQGLWQRRTENASGSKKGHGTSHCDRDHERRTSAFV